jgi:GAF domain-containing protein
MGGHQQWLNDLERAYRTSSEEEFAARIAGWRGTADRTVLAFAVLDELRALRRLLEQFARQGRG